MRGNTRRQNKSTVAGSLDNRSAAFSSRETAFKPPKNIFLPGSRGVGAPGRTLCPRSSASKAAPQLPPPSEDQRSRIASQETTTAGLRNNAVTFCSGRSASSGHVKTKEQGRINPSPTPKTPATVQVADNSLKTPNGVVPCSIAHLCGSKQVPTADTTQHNSNRPTSRQEAITHHADLDNADPTAATQPADAGMYRTCINNAPCSRCSLADLKNTAKKTATARSWGAKTRAPFVV